MHTCQSLAPVSFCFQTPCISSDLTARRKLERVRNVNTSFYFSVVCLPVKTKRNIFVFEKQEIGVKWTPLLGRASAHLALHLNKTWRIRRIARFYLSWTKHDAEVRSPSRRDLSGAAERL